MNAKKMGWVLALFLITTSVNAWAQLIPGKPIQIVVPFSAGGPTDLLARTVAARLEKELDHTVIVQNRPGAGGSIGAEYTARATPDGHTLMLGSLGTQAINPSVYSTLRYDPLRDFSYIGMVGEYGLVMVVNPSLDIHNVKDLVEFARANPGKLNYGSAGVGATGNLIGEMFKQMLDLQIEHVPYKGSTASLMAVIAGDLTFVFDIVSSALPQIEGGKVRPIAWTGGVRSPELPDVPTMEEAGISGLEVTSWLGLIGPNGMSKEVVAQLSDALLRIQETPEMQAELQKQGFTYKKLTPSEYTSSVGEDVKKWAEVIQKAGIKAE